MAPRTPQTAAFAKGCWNCRERKIGCDRSLPGCKNCVRRGKVCAGYGIKLSWPRPGDQRRAASSKARQHMVPVDPALDGEAEFLNTTAWDMGLYKEYTETGSHVEHIGSWEPHPSKPLKLSSIGLAELDPFLSIHNYSPVANILASFDYDRGDLFRLLVRMSLTDDSAGALAARHAISAVSFRHLNQDIRAAQHQSVALAALQTTIDKPLGAREAFQSMATSLILNIYETLDEGGSPLNWAIFFCGCKRIANLVHTEHDTYEGDQALILDWVFYHDVLYKFGIRHFIQKNDDQRALSSQRKIISKAVFDPSRQIIVPILGCSLELLDVLSQLIDLILDRDDPRFMSPDHKQALRTVELRLGRLRQVLPGKPIAH